MVTRPRWQKVLTDIVGNRARSILVTASVAVGLFAIGIIATLYLVVAADMDAAYRQVNPANIYLRTELFAEDHLAALRRLDGVTQVQGARIVDLRARNRDGEWQQIELIRLPALADMPLNQPRLLSGAWPPGLDEIVIEQNKLADLAAGLGGQVWIEQPDGVRARALTIRGTAQDLTLGAYTGGGGFFNAPMEGYISQDTLAGFDVPQPELLSGVFLTIAAGDDEAAIQAAAALAAKTLADNGVDVQSSATRRSSDHPNAYLISAIVGVLFVLGLLVVFLSGFLITNTFQALLSQQAQQIGIMKTVGARQSQIAGVYVALILGFGLLAFAISAPAAHFLSFALLNVLAKATNFVVQGQRIIWPALLLQAALAVVMPLAAAALPIWRGTRISVQDALSGRAQAHGGERGAPKPAAGGARLAKRAGDLLARLFSRPMLISLRNTFRRKGRLALTLLTLTLAGAVFIATFHVQVSLSRYIQQIGQYFLSDVTVSLDRPYRSDEIAALLGEVPGVARVEGWGAARAELILENGAAGDSVQMLAPPAGSPLIRPVLISGRWLQPGDTNAVALNEMFQARFPDLRPGDTLRLQLYGEQTEWYVTGFYRFAGKNGGYAAYTTDEALGRQLGMVNKATTFQVVSQHSLTAQEQEQLAQQIEARLDAAGIRVVDRTTGAYLTELAAGAFNILMVFLLFLAALTALVGSIGLAGTMSMNVLDRTREIGVMRAIGASDRALMQMVVVEGMLIGLLSYGLGALLSFPISQAMANGISWAVFEAPAQPGFSPTGFLLWLAMVLVLSFLASVAPARSAARLTIREVLAYE